MNERASLEDLLTWVKDHPLPNGQRVPVCIWSKGGAGTTQLLRRYSKEHDLETAVLQPAYLSASSELLGTLQANPKTGRSSYLPPKGL